MLKGSLTQILFQTSGSNLIPSHSSSFHPSSSHPSSSHQARPSKLISSALKAHPITSHNKRAIKPIQPQLNHLNQTLLSTQPKKLPIVPLTAPVKTFPIKKMGEIKSKVVINIQKMAERQLKMFQYQNRHKGKKYIHEQFGRKQQINRILVTSKYPNWQGQSYSFKSKQKSKQMEKEQKQRKRKGRSYQRIIENQCQFGETASTYKREQSASSNSPNNSPSSVNSPSGLKIYNLNNLQNYVQAKLGTINNNSYSSSPRRKANRQWQQQKKYQEQVQQQKRQILQLKKQLNKQYAKPFSPPQGITALAYVIYQTAAPKRRRMKNRIQGGSQVKKFFLHSHKIVAENNSRTALQIASLTKIMTCLVAIQLAQRYGVDMDVQQVVIGGFQENIGGTSARLRKGDIYTVKQLLYGLMLPSGNDASLALAVWGGRLLLTQNQSKSITQNNSTNVSSSFPKRNCYQRFIQQMNNKAASLCMQKTKYACSHGLANPQNRSCAFDIAILSQYAMNNQTFRQIVGCRCYQGEIRVQCTEKTSPTKRIQQQHKKYDQNQQIDDLQQQQLKNMCQSIIQMSQQQQYSPPNDYTTKTIRWQNSHMLLQNKPHIYSGIKTGITYNAGPCLASSIELNEKRYIVVVLNCKNLGFRFKDTENLRRWLWNKLEVNVVGNGNKQIEG